MGGRGTRGVIRPVTAAPAEHAPAGRETFDRQLDDLGRLTRAAWTAGDGAAAYRTLTALEQIARDGTPDQQQQATTILDRLYGRDEQRARAEQLAPVRNDIRAAVARLAREEGGPVSIAAMRDELGTRHDRATVDEALTHLADEPGVAIYPESNQKTLTQAKRDAALHMGAQDLHIIAIRPLTEQVRPGGPHAGGPGRTATEQVRAATSREQAAAALDGLTVKQLKDVAAGLREGGITLPTRANKDAVKRAITEYAVGRRLDSEAIERTAMGHRGQASRSDPKG
jgi:hypothetical protein